MVDRFEGFNDGLTSPGKSHFTVTPSNSADLPNATRAIRADSAGTISCRLVGDDVEVTYTVSAGEVLPIRVKRIMDTGTTVAVIQGWY